MKCLPLFNPAYVDMLDSFSHAINAMSFSRGRENHPRRVREFLFFLETLNIAEINDVRTTHIVKYNEYLRARPSMNDDGPLSGSSIRSHFNSIKYFFEHLLNSKRIESVPCSLPRLGFSPVSKERSALTEEEIKQLYEVATNKLDRAILACAYGCGMRRSELENLDVSDVHLGKREIVVRNGKNNKSRTIPLAEGVAQDLKEYLIYRAGRDIVEINTPAFFINRYQERMVGDRYNLRFKALVTETGNKELIAKKPSLHLLRHSVATHMLDRGCDAGFVRVFLGHVLLDTTIGIYAKRRKQKARLYELFKGHLAANNIKNL